MTDLLPWLEGSRAPASWPARAGLAALGALGGVYGGLQWLRTLKPDPFRAPCPVISVGNLTAGGTGKTPTVLWLARHLAPSGRRIAIVSRGYRQQSRAPVTVVADPDGQRLYPPLAADEASFLAGSLPGVAVLTGRHRPTLIRHAVERLHCDLVLMDDGFQRLDVYKDLDLLLLDAARPLGNGRLLPGGLLREFPSAIRRAHAVVLTRADDPRATLATRAWLAERFPQVPVMTATHRPTAWIPLHAPRDPLPLDGLTAPLFAFCAIAAPDRFFTTLRGLTLDLRGQRPFPDHHPFSPQETARLLAEAADLGATALVCTEKDAVKLDPARIDMPVFALRVEIAFAPAPLWLEQRLAALLFSA
ncbi:MAG: tetraacyldisaccharide 4'-kinase [Magnetococcales bacterium]|nr:tetraacyldisaccharide 4'-kinase [Magnetococcales bacterium]